ncbi:hypothetical protein NEOLEDRAFT_219152 [Neolentinus lepideus HHB14362 ss-1]|uniref:DUF6533 domain-containing protein n=1 Tax=Neolentinus lepideus HHB14362 ss-1 TaxID=1314782 RepID=A0A165MBM9_9AGAM|nr:hypothetical protein NEOLEDRAFT_219152 [Neolentinus lepideus HHB14362 ss-1]
MHSAEIAAQFIRHMHIQVIQYCQISALVLTVYDHASIFDREVELIWTGVVTRQASVHLQPILWRSNDHYNCCSFLLRRRLSKTGKILLDFIAWSGLFIGLSLQTILQLRIYALYNRSKVVTAVMFALYVGEIVALFVILGLSAKLRVVLNELVPGIRFCVMWRTSPSDSVFWVIVTIMDFILFSLAAWQSVQDYYRARGIHGGALLLKILLRDSFLYFLVAVGLYIADSIVFTKHLQNFLIPQIFTVTLVVVMGSRMILNLREAYYHPDADAYSDVDVSTFRAERPSDTSGADNSMASMELHTMTVTSGSCSTTRISQDDMGDDLNIQGERCDR